MSYYKPHRACIWNLITCLSALVQGCLLRLRRDGADYVRVLTVNTVGPFLMTKLFLPLLRYIHRSPLALLALLSLLYTCYCNTNTGF